MNYSTALLEAELAAYSPAEMMELVQTVSILFDAGDDDSTAFAVFRHRLEGRLSSAVAARMAAEQAAAQTATVIPFPGAPK